jgi:hypothetical protein
LACWIAEGEAHFSLRTSKDSPKLRPHITLAMSDEDVVARVGQIFGTTYFALSPQKPEWNVLYRTLVRGKRAYEIMRKIYPMMGARRKARFESIFDGYEYVPDQKGERHNLAKLDDQKVREIKHRLANKEFARDIAADYGVTIYTIREISQGKTWTHIKLSETEPALPKVDPLPVDYNSIYWLAGLLEGEGSFLAPMPSSPNAPIISVSMTDEDIIARVAAFFGTKYHRVNPLREGAKHAYTIIVKGSKAHDLMKTLYPLMSSRRQAQIDKALANYTYNPLRTITEETAIEVKRMLIQGSTIADVSRKFGLNYYLVRAIKRGASWKHISVD